MDRGVYDELGHDPGQRAVRVGAARPLPVVDAAEYVLWASDLAATRLDVLCDRLAGRHALIVASRSMARVHGHTLAAELSRSGTQAGAEVLLLPDPSADESVALQTLLSSFSWPLRAPLWWRSVATVASLWWPLHAA